MTLRVMSVSEGEADVPVLTEVFEGEPASRAVLDAEALQALAQDLERALLARLVPELERVVAEAVREALASLKRD